MGRARARARRNCAAARKRNDAVAVPASASPSCIAAHASIWHWRVHAPIRAHLIDRLDQLTSDAHQVDLSAHASSACARLRRLFASNFREPSARMPCTSGSRLPCSACRRSSSACSSICSPELILSVVDPETAAEFEDMYSPTAPIRSAAAHRRHRLDDVRLLYPQQHRRRLSVFRERPVRRRRQPVLSGVQRRFRRRDRRLSHRARSSATFYSFVVTHAAFELTAIVLSGAAGLRIGHSMLAPGRHTRTQALVVAARESIVIVYGVTAHAADRCRDRSVLVVGALDTARGEVLRRSGVLDRRARLSDAAGPPCRLMPLRFGCAAAATWKRRISACACVRASRARCITCYWRGRRARRRYRARDVRDRDVAADAGYLGGRSPGSIARFCSCCRAPRSVRRRRRAICGERSDTCGGANSAHLDDCDACRRGARSRSPCISSKADLAASGASACGRFASVTAVRRCC